MTARSMRRHWVIPTVTAAAIAVAAAIALRSFAEDTAGSTPTMPDADVTAPQSEPEATTPLDTAGEERLLKVLAKQVDVAFADTPLEEAVAQLARQAGVEIKVDKAAFTDVGLTADKHVTLSLKGVALESALSHVCRGIGMTWHVDDGVLVVTTSEAWALTLTTRIYPIADLVTHRDALGRTKIDSDPLLMLVTASCAPQTWDAVGGSGSIVAYGGMFVVGQTPAVHLAILDFLERLRRVRRQQATGDFSPVADNRHRERDDSFSKSLSKPITLRCDKTPLARFVEELRKASGVNVVFDRRALADNPFLKDTTISGEVTNEPIRSALRKLLKDTDAAWFVSHEAILVSSRDIARSVIVGYLYPVSDFVASNDHASLDDGEAEDDLIELVTQTVAPSTWDEVGGAGSIEYFKACGALAATNAPDVHPQIVDLLTGLRKVRRQQAQAAGDNTAANDPIEVRVYNVNILSRNGEKSAAEQCTEVVRKVIEPQSWSEDGVYLRAAAGSIVVKHRRLVQRQVRALLAAFHAPERVDSPELCWPLSTDADASDARDARGLSILAVSQFDLALKNVTGGARYGGEIGASPLGQRVHGDYRRLLRWNVANADDDVLFSLTLSRHRSEDAVSTVVLDGTEYYIDVTPYADEIIDLGIPMLDEFDIPLSGLGDRSIRELLADVRKCAVEAGDVLIDHK